MEGFVYAYFFSWLFFCLLPFLTLVFSMWFRILFCWFLFLFYFFFSLAYAYILTLLIQYFAAVRTSSQGSKCRTRPYNGHLGPWYLWEKRDLTDVVTHCWVSGWVFTPEAVRLFSTSLDFQLLKSVAPQKQLIIIIYNILLRAWRNPPQPLTLLPISQNFVSFVL